MSVGHTVVLSVVTLMLLNLLSTIAVHITKAGKRYFDALDNNEKRRFNLWMPFTGVAFWVGKLYINLKYKFKNR